MFTRYINVRRNLHEQTQGQWKIFFKQYHKLTNTYILLTNTLREEIKYIFLILRHIDIFLWRIIVSDTFNFNFNKRDHAELEI